MNKIDLITKRFTEVVVKLEIMACDTESVKTVCKKFLSNKKHSDLRYQDGYVYAAQSMSKQIAYQIMAHAETQRKLIKTEELRDSIHAAVSDPMDDPFKLMPQMLTVDGLSRNRIDFPICRANPALETGEAFQARDLIYIIWVNEISSEDTRLCSVYIDAVKRRTFRVLKDIAEKHKDEIGLVRMKEPKINGTEAYIPRGIFCVLSQIT